jgi:catalase
VFGVTDEHSIFSKPPSSFVILPKFPDLSHAIKRDPRAGLSGADNNWYFWTNLPEALHQVIVVMSDHRIPCSFPPCTSQGSANCSRSGAQSHRE